MILLVRINPCSCFVKFCPELLLQLLPHFYRLILLCTVFGHCIDFSIDVVRSVEVIVNVLPKLKELLLESVELF